MPLLSEPAMYTGEERLAIESQLERLLANPFFSHSRRFPSFLRYVVQETLAGNMDYLKERTLGVAIFGKDADYDTADDPIVRVTAAEIRKRIAQYYQEAGHEHEVRVSLPAGSYVPHFQFPVAQLPVAETEAEYVPKPHAGPAKLPIESPAQAVAVVQPVVSRRRLRPILVAFAVVLFGVLAAAGFFLWRQTQRSGVAEFWTPVLQSPDPVLFCLADQTQYTNLSLRDAADPSHLVTLQDSLTAVVIDDVDTITKIAGVLQRAGKHYTLEAEGKTSLTDLRNGPTVIIGAFDNAWALRLLQPLRFHFANNAQMTSFSILDSNPGDKPAWVVDRNRQIATNDYRDYAIVARFTDQMTGKPTVVAAGIGRGGTIAAGEFLTSPEMLLAVSNQMKAAHKSNVEVVLSTQIIDGQPGTPAVEATYFW